MDFYEKICKNMYSCFYNNENLNNKNVINNSYISKNLLNPKQLLL